MTNSTNLARLDSIKGLVVLNMPRTATWSQGQISAAPHPPDQGPPYLTIGALQAFWENYFRSLMLIRVC